MKTFGLFLSLVFFLFACRKDISFPNSESEKIFGTWEWGGTSGGIHGQSITPATEGYTMRIEFDRNGIYRTYKNGNKDEKLKFSLSTGTSMLLNKPAVFVNFSPMHRFPKRGGSSIECVRFSGEDTLSLFQDEFDGFGSWYIRSK